MGKQTHDLHKLAYMLITSSRARLTSSGSSLAFVTLMIRDTLCLSVVGVRGTFPWEFVSPFLDQSSSLVDEDELASNNDVTSFNFFICT